MAPQYLPLFRPADTVTFSASTAVVGGEPVEVGATDWSVAPAAAGSAKYVGVPGHDAAVGEKVTVEVGKRIDQLKANGAITRGQRLEAAGAGAVKTLASGTATHLALNSATNGQPVAALQL